MTFFPWRKKFLLLFVHEKNGRSSLGLNSEVKKLFLEYSWPGNIRELRNVMERAAIVEAQSIEVALTDLLSAILAENGAFPWLP